MSGIKIRGTGRFAPAKIVTNDDLAKIVDTSDEWITTRTGIQTRHHCTTETHTDMCVGLCGAVVAGLDAGAGGDPLVAGVHDLGQIVVGDDFRGRSAVLLILIPLMLPPSGVLRPCA